MADIIRAATPLTNKNIVAPLREHQNPDLAPFDIQNPNRITKPIPNSEILKQNTGNIDQQAAPEILLDLLKDPSVTVSFIKNIMMLQEIVGIISMQNKPVTEEFEQLFKQLAVKPENLAEELINQETASTAFKGDLFDFLRNMLKGSSMPEMESGNSFISGLFSKDSSMSSDMQMANNQNNSLNEPSPALKSAVVNVLKAVNTENCKSEILKALSGTMSYLSETLSPNKALSEKLADLSRRFASPEAENEFTQLKNETAKIITDIEKSIMFTGKLKSLCSMITYNLSRYNTNTNFLSDAARELMAFIPEETERTAFLQKLYDCLAGTKESSTNSKVLDILVKILEKQTDSESVMQMKGESVESVIHSLLSSPSNFTPLLHFIIPIDDGTFRAFGEMWINPDEEEDPKKKKSGLTEQNVQTIHMLLVFDIPEIGRFETELYVRDKKIDLSVYCPESIDGKIPDLSADLRKCIKFSEYSFDEIKIGRLEKPRSLVEVFPALPRKRTGINVRI